MAINVMINLTKAKGYITKNKAGEDVLYIDVAERKEVGQYGDTHTVKAYNKELGSAYVGNAKEKVFNNNTSNETQKASKPSKQEQREFKNAVNTAIQEGSILDLENDNLPF